MEFDKDVPVFVEAKNILPNKQQKNLTLLILGG